MTDTNILVGIIASKRISRNKLADKIGMAYRTFNSKLLEKGAAEFRPSEIVAIVKALELSNDAMMRVFFPELRLEERE